jgi:hypothetical protein
MIHNDSKNIYNIVLEIGGKQNSHELIQTGEGGREHSEKIRI